MHAGRKNSAALKLAFTEKSQNAGRPGGQPHFWGYCTSHELAAKGRYYPSFLSTLPRSLSNLRTRFALCCCCLRELEHTTLPLRYLVSTLRNFAIIWRRARHLLAKMAQMELDNLSKLERGEYLPAQRADSTYSTLIHPWASNSVSFVLPLHCDPKSRKFLYLIFNQRSTTIKSQGSTGSRRSRKFFRRCKLSLDNVF